MLLLYIYLKQDGTTIWTDIIRRRLRFGDKLAESTLSLDVTKRERAKEKLRKFNEESRGRGGARAPLG